MREGTPEVRGEYADFEFKWAVRRQIRPQIIQSQEEREAPNMSGMPRDLTEFDGNGDSPGNTSPFTIPLSDWQTSQPN
jgi:hypothetical protein